MAKKLKKRLAGRRETFSQRRSQMLSRQDARPKDYKPAGLRARMAAEGGQKAELYLYDEIGGWGIWAEDVVREIAPLGHLDHLAVRINTPGGNVDDAVAIMSFLSRAADSVTTSVDGAAISCGSLIAQAGHVREIASGGLMMLHEPWMRVIGNTDELRSAADTLEMLSATAAQAYADRSGRHVDEITALMVGPDGSDGTWLGAQAAIDAKLADVVVQITPASMAFKAGAMQCRPPAWAAALLVGEGDPQMPRQMAADAARRRADLDRRVRIAEASLSV